MATPTLSREDALETIEMIHEALRDGKRPPGKLGSGMSALEAARINLCLASSGSMTTRLRRAKELYGLEPDWSLWKKPQVEAKRLVEAAPAAELPDREVLLGALKKGPISLEDLSQKLDLPKWATLRMLEEAKEDGLNIHEGAGGWSISGTIAPQEVTGRVFEYVSRPDNTFVFGAISDNHYCSKWAREDVAEDLYDKYAAAGVDRVFNGGNWIDGQMEFNKHEITVHGMEEQVRYLTEHYPHRDGINTYAIAGEDHEGFFCRRESIDIGRFTEKMMRDAGREDWYDLGFIEAKVDLVNANTGAKSSLLVMHPGGGSSYAISYKPQKIVESLEGGEKPAVLLIGHLHKLSVNLIRNVWALQIGCTQDQSTFMRKKNLDAQVGGMIVSMEQDPATGAITSLTPQIYRYFLRSYYNDRWKKVGDVVLPGRFT